MADTKEETKKKKTASASEDTLDLGAKKKKTAKKASAKTAEKDEPSVVKKEKTEPKSEKAEKADAPPKKKTKKATKKTEDDEEKGEEKSETPKKKTAPSTDLTEVSEKMGDLDLSAPKKKKKAKKDAEPAAATESAAEPASEPTAEAGSEAGAEGETEEGNEDGEFGAKKKKKKDALPSESLPEDDYTKSDRDYHYGELLSRVFSMLAENNPELLKSKKKQILIKPPEVLRVGTKKTVWANYQEICSMMHRPSDHVLAYTCTELGTTASIDGNQRLVINGRFQPKQIESIVRRYVADYVSCGTCKSPDTILKKENRLFFIKCKACGSTRSVQAIKQGFVAQIGKRKK